MDTLIKERVHIVQFQLEKPANLPFHLMGWLQTYIQTYNCKGFRSYPNPYNENYYDYENITNINYNKGFGKKNFHLNHKISQSYINNDIHNPKNSEIYEICSINLLKNQYNGIIKVLFHQKSLIHTETKDLNESIRLVDFKSMNDKNEIYKVPLNYYHPIRYTYYTESDQIVKYDNYVTFQALSSILNDTTFVSGRRKEKNVDSNPKEYMSGLDIWRECGKDKYSFIYPNETLIRLVAN